jgi:hypothetical protein
LSLEIKIRIQPPHLNPGPELQSPSAGHDSFKGDLPHRSRWSVLFVQRRLQCIIFWLFSLLHDRFFREKAMFQRIQADAPLAGFGFRASTFVELDLFTRRFASEVIVPPRRFAPKYEGVGYAQNVICRTF